MTLSLVSRWSQKEHRHLPSDPAQCTPIQLYKDRSKTILQGFPFFLSAVYPSHSNSETGQNLNNILPIR